jgi:hypothetical protein
MNAKRTTPVIFFLALLLTNITAISAPLSGQAEQLEATGSAAPADARLPDYYPASLQNKGTIQRVESGDVLVVNGVRYRLSPNARIHTLDTEFAPRQALAAGMDIAFTLGPVDQRGRTIAEIWVLPAGTIPPH